MSVGNASQSLFTDDKPSASSWDPRAVLPGLTSLRGIAAVIVVLFHVEGVLSRHGVDLALGPFGGAVKNGYLFVDLFFILSGLVIAHVYGQRTFDSAKVYGHFLWNRLARIYPLHLFATAVLILSRLVPNSPPVFNESDTPASLVSEMLLVKSFGFHEPFTWNDVSWSISAEWIAYLFAPILLLIVRPGRSTPRVAVGVIAAAWFGITLISADAPFPEITQQGGTVRGVLLFASGVALYRLHRLQPVVSLASRTVAFPLTLGVILVLTSIKVHDVLLMLVFAAFILVTVHAPRGVLKALDCRPLIHLGEISYSVYLLQVFALLIFQEFVASKSTAHWENSSQGSMWLVVALFVGGLVVVSHLTYRTIERPAQVAMRRVFVRRT